MSKSITNEKDSYLLNVHKISLILRVGLGLVFISGGLNKLYYFLNSVDSVRTGMVDKYMGTTGYVNEFFTNYLFTEGGFFTPHLFLTLLSSVEFIFGLMLVIGFLVRPVSLISAFMFWSFVVALPVLTVPTVGVDVKTYTTPSLLMMIRDIALSGLLFVLYNLGSGLKSLDKKYFGQESWVCCVNKNVSWNSLALVIRLSLGFVFIVGGLFAGASNIATFGTPSFILFILGVLILVTNIKYLGYIASLLFIYYMISKLNFDKGLLGYLNSVKREFALLAAAIVLGMLGSGKSHIINLSKFKSN